MQRKLGTPAALRQETTQHPRCKLAGPLMLFAPLVQIVQIRKRFRVSQKKRHLPLFYRNAVTVAVAYVDG